MTGIIIIITIIIIIIIIFIIIITIIIIIPVETQKQYCPSLNKYVPEDSFHNPNEEWYFSHENSVVQIESLIKYDEIESLIKSTPNGKSGGRDGVPYEDFKYSCDDYCHVLVNIMNVMLINHRLSSY